MEGMQNELFFYPNFKGGLIRGFKNFFQEHKEHTFLSREGRGGGGGLHI